jgi:hypothetical protein
MAAVIDFGGDEGDEGQAAGDEDEDERGEAGDDDADEDEDDEVPLSFDNTLGSQVPAFVEYVAVAGQVPELPVGMTLVELPANAPSVEQSSDGALRAQLVQAQRQAELAAIDRQALLEKVDALESERARLEQQATELRDNLARAVTEESPQATEAAERLQTSLADNQALRWKVQQLERELEAAKARPVEVLEAEVAALRAELAERREVGVGDGPMTVVEEELGEEVTTVGGAGVGDETDAGSAADGGDEADDGVATDADDLDDEADTNDLGEDDEPELAVERREMMVYASDAVGSDAEEAAQRIRYRSALAELDRLVERVERGGIGVLPLRQALVSLRKRLRG